MEGHADTHKLEPEILWENRPPTTIIQMMWASLFYIGLAIQLGLGFYVIAIKNIVMVPKGNCGSGYVSYGSACVADDLHKEFLKCVDEQISSGTGARRLASAHERTLWDALEEFPEVPAVLIISMLFLAALWLKVLQIAARPVVWSTIALTEALLLYFTIRPATVENGTPGWGFLGTAVAMAAWFIYKRKAVDGAATMISQASLGLIQSPSVLMYSSIVFIMRFGYIALWCFFMIESAAHWEVTKTDDGQCTLTSSQLSHNIRMTLGALFYPTAFFFSNACLIVCAAGIGAWYLDQDKPRSEAALAGLKWAFTSSAGPSYFCALINSVITYARSKANSQLKYLFCFFPLHCLAWVLMAMVEQCVRAFTRLMLISHTFHGGDTIQTATNAFNVLKKRLGDFITTDSVATMVLGWSVAMFSTAFGFAAWAWLDDRMESGLLNTIGDSAVKGGSADILIFGLVFVMYLFVSNPMIAVILLSLLGEKIKFDAIIGFLGGVFVGSICCLFFTAFAQIILNSTDTIFYCYALEADANKRQDGRFDKLYAMIESSVVVGVPVDDPFAPAAQGTPQIVGNQQQNYQQQKLGQPNGVVQGTAPQQAQWPAGQYAPQQVQQMQQQAAVKVGAPPPAPMDQAFDGNKE